jgi:hypothetical protein
MHVNLYLSVHQEKATPTKPNPTNFLKGAQKLRKEGMEMGVLSASISVAFFH